MTFPPGSIVPSQGVEFENRQIDLQNGYPTDQSVTRLYDELDFQRAVQAYIWAMPTVAIDALRIANVRDWGVDYNGVGIVDKFTTPAVLALTGNSTTIYAAAFADLGRDGPVVVDSPPGAYGVIDDYWQRPVVEIGPFGPDKGKRRKIPACPARLSGPSSEGIPYRSLAYEPCHVPGPGLRDNGNVKSAVDTLAKISIYPLSQAGNPPKTHIFMAGDKGMDSIAPRGFGYWEQLADILNQEPVDERDRFFHAMLMPLGIAKGKPFQPDERQKKILTDAAELGFLMAQTISMVPPVR